jgi:S-(hydroxymethyl)glutathione dehydrogenase/alcohol dehydrogenase
MDVRAALAGARKPLEITNARRRPIITFDCTGNVTVMRQALEARHCGWGQSTVTDAPARAEISTRPFQLVSCRVSKGTAFGGARPHRRAQKYMDGKQIDPMITHVMPVAEINAVFELMKPGLPFAAVMTFELGSLTRN